MMKNKISCVVGLVLLILLLGYAKTNNPVTVVPEGYTKVYTYITIEAGDTLDSIVDRLMKEDNMNKVYDCRTLKKEIIKMNNISNEDVIHYGNNLAIPVITK